MAEEKIPEEAQPAALTDLISMECGECMYLLGKVNAGGKFEAASRTDLKVHLKFAKHVLIKKG